MKRILEISGTFGDEIFITFVLILKEYFQILGLPETADIGQIKKAYRDKAKKYHPDFNKEPGAQQKFIEVTQAYDILLDYKSGKFVKKAFAKTSYTQSTSKEEIKRRKKEAAMKRAQEFAEMRFREFSKTDYYKVGNAMEVLMNHFLFLLGIFLYTVLPFIMYAYGGAGAVIGAVVTAVISIPITWPALKNFNQLWGEEFVEAIKIFLKNKVIQGLLLSALNILVYSCFAFNTAIPTSAINFIFTVAMFGTLVFTIVRERNNKFVLSFIYAPAIINAFFLVNYTLSFFPQKETHHYEKFSMVSVGSRRGDIIGVNLYLDSAKYEGYYGVTYFHDRFTAEMHRCVEYTFKTGIFGMRVLKNHEFVKCKTDSLK
ncbi:MAG: chaperone protein DnaJ [Bacteroidetes bacterium]|nr:chaperone protein DnaJ [Bacteroidota bacterium]